MPDIKLTIIPKPEEGTAAVLEHAENGQIPIMQGQGNYNYICGNCSNILLKSVDEGQVSDVVLKCPNCEKYNEV